MPLGKVWYLLFSPAMGYIVPQPFFHKDGFGIEWLTKVNMAKKKKKSK